MISAPLTNNHMREMAIDLVSTPFYVEHFAPMFKRPEEQTTFDKFSKPFKHKVWLAVLASLPLGGLFIWVSGSGHNKRSTLTQALWFVYGAILCQGEIDFRCSEVKM